MKITLMLRKSYIASHTFKNESEILNFYHQTCILRYLPPSHVPPSPPFSWVFAGLEKPQVKFLQGFCRPQNILTDFLQTLADSSVVKQIIEWRSNILSPASYRDHKHKLAELIFLPLTYTCLIYSFCCLKHIIRVADPGWEWPEPTR